MMERNKKFNWKTEKNIHKRKEVKKKKQTAKDTEGWALEYKEEQEKCRYE